MNLQKEIFLLTNTVCSKPADCNNKPTVSNCIKVVSLIAANALNTNKSIPRKSLKDVDSIKSNIFACSSQIDIRSKINREATARLSIKCCRAAVFV